MDTGRTVRGVDPYFEVFPLSADAWDYLEAYGFVQRGANELDFPHHLEFDHPEGHWAIMYLPESEQGDQETELKIYPASR